MKTKIPRNASMAFGEPGAKQSQGEKPCNAARFSRTVAVDHGVWSHPSLHSRCGMKVSATWPLLARLPSPRPSPLGLSGSGLCFDGTHLAARPSEIRGTSAPDVDQPAKVRARYHIGSPRARSLRQSGETQSGATTQIGAIRRMSTRSAQQAPRRPNSLKDKGL